MSAPANRDSSQRRRKTVEISGKTPQSLEFAYEIPSFESLRPATSFSFGLFRPSLGIGPRSRHYSKTMQIERGQALQSSIRPCAGVCNQLSVCQTSTLREQAGSRAGGRLTFLWLSPKKPKERKATRSLGPFGQPALRQKSGGPRKLACGSNSARPCIPLFWRITGPARTGLSRVTADSGNLVLQTAATARQKPRSCSFSL